MEIIILGKTMVMWKGSKKILQQHDSWVVPQRRSILLAFFETVFRLFSGMGQYYIYIYIYINFNALVPGVH